MINIIKILLKILKKIKYLYKGKNKNQINIDLNKLTKMKLI